MRDNSVGTIPNEFLKYKELFLKTAKIRIQKLIDNQKILKSDSTNKEVLGSNQIEAHSLKGEAAIMQLNNFAYLAHILEDIFDYAKNDYLKISKEMLPLLEVSYSKMEKCLKEIEDYNREINLEKEIKELKGISGVKTDGIGPSPRSKEGKPILENLK